MSTIYTALDSFLFPAAFSATLKPGCRIRIRVRQVYTAGTGCDFPVERSSFFPTILINDYMYVQEVVTLQKKYLIYLHQKMRFTTFINYYNTLG